MPASRRRRTFWTVAWVIVVGVPIFAGLAIGVPYTLMHLGVSREYGWSFWRVGHKELRRWFDLSGGSARAHPIYSGPVFARAGEKLDLRYRISPAKDSRGPVTLLVSEQFGAHTFWRHRFDHAAAGRVEITLGTDHFYTIVLGYTGYLGTAAVDWNVVRPAP